MRFSEKDISGQRWLSLNRRPEQEAHRPPRSTSTTLTSILLVEDEDAHAALALEGFAVQSDRFSVSVASSLAEARRELKESHPDLMICDLVLPDGRATDLLADSDLAYRLPVVVLTSQGDEQAAVEVLKRGAVNYVVKSVTTLSNLYRIAEDAIKEWSTKFVCVGPSGGHIKCALQGQLDRLRRDLKMTRGELQTSRLVNRSLQEQVGHLKTTLELADLAAAWIDADGRVVFVSDKMVERMAPDKDIRDICDVDDLSPDLDPATWPEQWRKLSHYRILALHLRSSEEQDLAEALPVTASLISTDLGEFCFLQISDRPAHSRQSTGGENRLRSVDERTAVESGEVLL